MATQYPWYHGNITRLQTEQLLHQSGKDGSFVVRDSENIKGAYVLSVLCEGRIYQYRIVPDTDGTGFLMKSSDPQSKFHPFSNLSELVSSYKIANNGLCCPLHHGVEAKKDEEEQDSDDDDEDKLSSDTSGSSSQEGTLHVLQRRLDTMDVSSLNGDFVGLLRDYVSRGVREDSEEVRSGAPHATNLRKVVMASTKELTKQLNIFQLQLEALQCLFDVQTPSSRKLLLRQQSEYESSPENLYKKFAECEMQVKNLEAKVKATLRDLYKPSLESHSPTSTLLSNDMAEPEEEPPTYMPPPESTPKNDKLPKDIRSVNVLPVHFEVKMEGLNVQALKHLKVKLTVDVATGQMVVAKITGKDMYEDVTFFTHDKIAQLIKSRTYNTKLCIKFTTGKKKEYSFEDAKKRETFCQLLQYMKMVHSKSKEVDQVSIFIGTWNMGDAPPPNSITSWLTSQGDGKTRDSRLLYMPHDLYVIGTQESTLSERDWLTRLKAEIQSVCKNPDSKEYVTVTVCSLWGIRIAVLVKPEHQHRISHLRESSVKTGIANALGNKGAVGVSFFFNGTSFCFVNCHLTSGTEKCTRRNNNFHDILKGLSLGAKGLSLFDLTNQFHHMFWLGDLNYRIDWNVQEILNNIDNHHYEVLFDHDQLKIEKDQGHVLVGFEEDDITFPPTYRYELGHRTKYAYKKIKKTCIRINQPSWCDRVLWKSYPSTHVINTTYGCSTDIVTSDHSPVFATFDVGISCSTVIPKDQGKPETQDVKIIFTSLDATIITSMCSSRFYLEFFSSCLDAKSIRSSYNSVCQQNNTLNHTKPSWGRDDLPKLTPIVSDMEYLEEQFILVAIKSEDSDESYGEFVVSLRDKFMNTPVTFRSILTHHGQKTGDVEVSVHVKARDESLYGGFRKTKTYELVAFEDKVDSLSSTDTNDDTSGRINARTKACIGVSKVLNWVKSSGDESSSRKSHEDAPPIPTTPRPRDLHLPDSGLLLADSGPVPPSRRRNGPKTQVAKPAAFNGHLDDSDMPPPLPPPRASPSPMGADAGVYMGLNLEAPQPNSSRMDMPQANSSRTIPSKQMSSENDMGWGAPQYQKQKLKSSLSVPTDSGQGDTPPPLPSRQALPFRTPSREAAPPPLPARPILSIQNLANRSDSETSDEGWMGHSPPRRTPPPLPPEQGGSNVRRIRNQFEQGSSRDSSPDSSRSSGGSHRSDRDGKPALPMRMVERTAPEGRASSTSMDDAAPLLEGLPPPLPAKSKVNTPPRRISDGDQEEYDSLRRPRTITEWLSNMGLMQYKRQLYDNGWDNVSFLDTISDQDLLDAHVENPEHRRRMLESITCIMAMQR